MPIESVRINFSQRWWGDGIALDPISTIVGGALRRRVSCCSREPGIVLAIANGIELLMHIGLDTINLKGKGFTPKVKNGDKVKAGDLLIDFDADFIATHAKSLLTMIVVTNPESVASFKVHTGAVTAGEDPILDLELAADDAKADAKASAGATGKPITSEAILISNTSGLHARPAAVLANVAKKYTSTLGKRGDDKAMQESHQSDEPGHTLQRQGKPGRPVRSSGTNKSWRSHPIVFWEEGRTTAPPAESWLDCQTRGRTTFYVHYCWA